MAAPGHAAGSSKTVVWALRSLVLGSSVATVFHLYPVWREASMVNAVELASSSSARFAYEGIRRLRRQCGEGSSRRRELLRRGAVSALARAAGHEDALVRDAALGAVAAFVVAEGVEGGGGEVLGRGVVGLPEVARGLVNGECAGGCLELWQEVVGGDRPVNRQDRVGRLKRAVDTYADADADGEREVE